jgi:hypothetical protein
VIRQRLNFLIDVVTLVVMWAMLTSGLLIRYVLPPGTGRWLAVGGMNRHEWGDIHFYLALLLCAILLTHVSLHWQWVCTTARRLFSTSEPNGHLRLRAWRMVWGTALMVVLASGTTFTLWQANRMVASNENLPGGGAGGRALGRGLHGRAAAAPNGRTSTLEGHGIQARNALCEESHAGVRHHADSPSAQCRRTGSQAPCPEEPIGRCGPRQGFDLTDPRPPVQGAAVDALLVSANRLYFGQGPRRYHGRHRP